jgi:hypothetical protein
MEINTLILKLNKNLDEQDRANCFNAVELYWQDSKQQRFTGPQEFVEYVAKNFKQISLEESPSCGDVSIIWSRSDFRLPLGKIDLNAIAGKREGYPFGLIIEHSLVHIEKNQVFHKPDPKSSSIYETTTLVGAINPYEALIGFELTRHRRL